MGMATAAKPTISEGMREVSGVNARILGPGLKFMAQPQRHLWFVVAAHE